MISLLLGLTLNSQAHPNHTQDWENWDSIAACQEDHQNCHDIYEQSPRATRNPNILRFPDPNLQGEQWVELHLLRLQDPNTDLAVRLALVDLLSHSEGDWESGVQKFITDPEEKMRASIAESTRFGSATYAREVLTTLVTDSSPMVRETAIRAIAKQDARDYTNILENALHDSDEMVQLATIRTIGWTKLNVQTTELTPFLKSQNPELRLHSLRTISRLSPTQAKQLPQLKSLTSDTDPRIQREVLRIQKQ